MKKILFFVVAMAAIFAFDSCKKSEVSPTDVALQSMELLKNKDYKGYAELVYFADSITSDSTKLKAKKRAMLALWRRTSSRSLRRRVISRSTRLWKRTSRIL